jgi:hypothetical protein
VFQLSLECVLQQPCIAATTVVYYDVGMVSCWLMSLLEVGTETII